MDMRDNSTVEKSGKKKGFAVDFYKSQTWEDVSRGYRASVFNLCERCKAKGLIVPAQEVHHKIKLTPENINNPEIALNWDNLEALCKDCHLKEHRKKKRWSVDTEGNVTLEGPPI